MEYLLIANAAMALLEKLLPQIQSAATRGEITAQQQQEVRDRYAALRAQGDSAFSGPEWQIESGPTAPLPPNAGM